MKKLLLLSLLIILGNSLITAQVPENIKPHKFSVHVDGSSTDIVDYNSVSINLERRLFINESQNFRLFARGSFNYLFYNFFGKNHSKGPGVSLVLLAGKRKHHFEVNLGITLLFERYYRGDGTSFFLFYLADLGYRYQIKEHLFLRAKAGLLGLGVGVGYTF